MQRDVPFSQWERVPQMRRNEAQLFVPFCVEERVQHCVSPTRCFPIPPELTRECDVSTSSTAPWLTRTLTSDVVTKATEQYVTFCSPQTRTRQHVHKTPATRRALFGPRGSALPFHIATPNEETPRRMDILCPRKQNVSPHCFFCSEPNNNNQKMPQKVSSWTLRAAVSDKNNNNKKRYCFRNLWTSPTTWNCRSTACWLHTTSQWAHIDLLGLSGPEGYLGQSTTADSRRRSWRARVFGTAAIVYGKRFFFSSSRKKRPPDCGQLI